ncbi:MAG: hypothetical protein IGQ88_01075 [Gloeomargaritaceae cyanobacterium C42_A2020_066]|nr:hypothetical protein [Gloeomargaritaceae cyanobacterium C42_A2020_066]
MIQDEPTLRDLLSQTHLVDAAVATLEVSGTAEIAFAIDIPTEDPVSTWFLLRGLMPQTDRWPLLTTSWSKASSWEATVAAADFFDRSAFQWERMKGDRSGDTPADVIAAAASLDSEAELNALASQSEANLVDELEIALYPAALWGHTRH